MKISMSTEPGYAWLPPVELKRRIDTIPLPKKLKTSFTHFVMKWEAHSGTEWTVARLKSFKDCLLNSYSEGGNKYSHKPEWFATTGNNRLSGVFGRLWTVAMTDAAKLRAVLALVHVYTGAVRTEWSEAEMAQTIESIRQSPVHLPKRGRSVSRPGKSTAYKALRSLGWVGKLRIYAKPAPLVYVLPGKESHAKRVIDDIQSCPDLGIYLTDELRTHLGGVAGCLKDPVKAQVGFSSIVGCIHASFEPGLKTRYFAAPNLVLQRALEPLKEKLLEFCKRVPWDCSHDQRKADKTILSALRRGRLVHSVDLSKATDSFPWEWQVECLRILTSGKEAKMSVDLLQCIVRHGSWTLPDGSSVKFTKGQPLGLGPSFPLFAVSHGILLYSLNGNKWNHDFFVLGDDVIIFDDALAKSYREVLQSWAVETSEAKSFTSGRIAQFAGVTYTADLSFWTPKWLPFKKEALVDLERWWYPGLLRGFKEHGLVTRVLALPPPFGIGRNPHGIPLDERLTPQLVDAILDREDRRAKEAKASVTRPAVQQLLNILRKEGLSSEALLTIAEQIRHSSRVAYTYWVSYLNRQRRPVSPLTPEVAELAHGNSLVGYPRMRLLARKRGRSHTLGSTKSWKRLFARIDSAKDSA